VKVGSRIYEPVFLLASFALRNKAETSDMLLIFPNPLLMVSLRSAGSKDHAL